MRPWRDLLFSTDRVKVNEVYVNLAKQSFQSSLSKYKEGTVDITAVVNSLTDLADARYSLVMAKKDWFTSLTQLAYATGTLWRGSCF
ncbi:MAG: TolC family protein [Waddliaceae bacterium]